MVLKGYKQTEEHRGKISKALKGKKKSTEHKKALSKARKIIYSKKGFIHWSRGRKATVEEKLKMSRAHRGKKFSKETREKISKKMKGRKASLETRKKMSIARRGSGSYLWKGGLTDINKKIRMSLDYRLWREAVFTRDKWTCVICGNVGGKLAPDHIKPFSLFPELRFDIENGRTLCHDCHKKTPTYGINLVRAIKINAYT